MRYQRMVLAARPRGAVQVGNFRLETVEARALEDGEVLVRNEWLSLDPYMRGRMSEAKSYAVPQALDETMIGATAGYVVASRDAHFAVGDAVTGMLGWAEMGIAAGDALRKVDTARVALSAYLGVAGMPGVTAWYGLHEIMRPRAGETIVVSAAAGAVGSVVGQLAKRLGCRAVGIAGGPEKCRYVVEELGFDACVDYKAGNLKADLKAATPDGVDGVFENVGGVIFDTTLTRMNAFGRVALCGLIAGYNGDPQPLHNLKSILLNRLTVRGFIITEHPEVWPAALADLEPLVAAGQLKYRESIADGLASAPAALVGLLSGANFGKQLVHLP
ncbi:NADP-dependent oxidoreductase [Massilia arenosa]|uniref:NADP-dependent oxidoreductase n=1 Tax=Zemynaea arenosa TaxID=2561931 RepID=A0A4Y9RQU0_9BURK|nr:NADP-dependent oxidoreductase [Massilia arenosa]TFW11470.1 NADP-dependent oxidoreductase [Massilia arenosa]